MLKLLTIFLFFYICSDVSQASNKVVLISFDGYRHDYYDVYKPKSLQRIAKNGVYAPDGIISAFATKTFPNHYTIVTGLYEENHGIIDNDMYDPLYNETFALGNVDPKWWNEGEPIWVTARKQGKKTAAAFWPGSDAIIKGTRPNYFVKFDPKITFKDRVDQAIKWLTVDNVDFVAVYFQDPDTTAHKYGIFTPQMEQSIKNGDKALTDFLDQLNSKKLTDKVDIIVMADHGMVNTSNVPGDDSKVIYIDNFVNPNDITLVPQTGSIAGILPKPGRVEAVYKGLKKAKHIDVYKKEDIPEDWHYKHHRRIMPIVAVAEEGYIIAKNKKEIGVYTIGQHGYNNTLSSMKPIFFATGPSFKKGVTIDSFENVHVYSLLCHLLGVKPSPNNGNMNAFKRILKKP